MIALAGWAPVVLGLGALPLVLSDLKDMEVSWGALGIFSLWALGTAGVLDTGHFTGHLMLGTGTLAVGTLLARGLGEKIGEADLVFVAALGLVLGFWDLLLAAAFGCGAAFGAYAWMVVRSGPGALERPLPFLPCLFWGGLVVEILGRATVFS